jgi:ribosomal protein S18 acetylase RimI-like enzyme
MTPFEPTLAQTLAFCAEDPIERVFLEDAARRGYGQFVALGDGELTALCHAGANIVPSGTGCGAFAHAALAARPRMLIGEAHAVGELWEATRERLAEPREDRLHQPVYTITKAPPPGDTGLRAARPDDLDTLLPACAEAHRLELGVDPRTRDAEGFRWRTAAQIEDGRSWLWVEDGVVLFKAEASAWTPHAVQVAQVWTDPEARGHGYATRALADLFRLLLAQTPAVTLFVRTDNSPAIALYERLGMEKTLEYRSVLL